MKKLLVVAGLAGAFFIGSMSTGNIFTSANTDTLQNTVTKQPAVKQGGMMGQSGMMGQGGMMGLMQDMHNDMLSVAAKTLKMTTEDLQKAMQDGKSLAEIAKNEGVESATLTENMKKVMKNHLNQLEKDGKISSQQKEMMLSRMGDNFDMMLNKTSHPCMTNNLNDSNENL